MFHFAPLCAKYWPFVKKHANPIPVSDMQGVIMVDDNDSPVAAGVMDTWTPNSCNVHVVVTNPMVLRHGFLEEAFWFIFEQNERKMVWGFTPSDNARALRFNEHIGMVEQFRMKDAHADGVDYVVTRMLKEECRWLSEGLQWRRKTNRGAVIAA